MFKQYKEKICSETGDECEYEPTDDEPCHQCRIFRNIDGDKIKTSVTNGFRIEV